MHTLTFIKEVNHIEMLKEWMLDTIFHSLRKWWFLKKVIIRWLEQIIHYLLRSFTLVCYNSYYFLTEWSNFAVNHFDRSTYFKICSYFHTIYPFNRLLYISYVQSDFIHAFVRIGISHILFIIFIHRYLHLFLICLNNLSHHNIHPIFVYYKMCTIATIINLKSSSATSMFRPFSIFINHWRTLCKLFHPNIDRFLWDILCLWGVHFWVLVSNGSSYNRYNFSPYM